MERWRQLTTVRASIVTGGELWDMKGVTMESSPREMTVSLHEERASVDPFGSPDYRTDFTPERVAIETLDCQVVAERDDPRASFAGHEMTTAWDPLHLAYFNGYALWTYMTTPFLLTSTSAKFVSAETRLNPPR